MENIFYSPAMESLRIPRNESRMHATVKRGKYLATAGFVMTGIFAAMAFTADFWAHSLRDYGTGSDSSHPGFPGFITVIYLIMGMIYFFPAFSLFRFSARTQNAIDQGNHTVFEKNLGSLKSYLAFNWLLLAIAFLFLIAGMILILYGPIPS